MDVTDEGSIADMVAATVGEFGGLHVPGNHVGGTDPRTDLDQLRMDTGEYDRAVALNMRSTLLGARHAVPHMVRAGGGSVVNTAPYCTAIDIVPLTTAAFTAP